jgi:hypothetical protein
LCRVCARSLKGGTVFPPDLHEANPARAIGFQSLVIAEGRYLYTRLLSSVQDGAALLYLNFAFINDQADHIHTFEFRSLPILIVVESFVRVS